MSRIGKQPIPLPAPREGGILDGAVQVHGPKGTLSRRPSRTAISCAARTGATWRGRRDGLQAPEVRSTALTRPSSPTR